MATQTPSDVSWRVSIDVVPPRHGLGEFRLYVTAGPPDDPHVVAFHVSHERALTPAELDDAVTTLHYALLTQLIVTHGVQLTLMP